LGDLVAFSICTEQGENQSDGIMAIDIIWNRRKKEERRKKKEERLHLPFDSGIEE
jgi:hypothetical protein